MWNKDILTLRKTKNLLLADPGWCWSKDRSLICETQQNPKIDPYKYGQLTFDKDTLEFSRKSMVLEKLDIYMQKMKKNLYLNLIICTKINLKHTFKYKI